MPWFYYTGKTIRPIQIKKGVSVAVRPNSHVEVEEVTRETRALIGKVLKRKGRPNGMRSFVDIDPPQEKMVEVLPKPEIAKFVAEKGFTKSKDEPPVSNNVEMVESEIAIANSVGVEEKMESEVDNVVSGDGLPVESKKTRKRKSKKDAE